MYTKHLLISPSHDSNLFEGALDRCSSVSACAAQVLIIKRAHFYLLLFLRPSYAEREGNLEERSDHEAPTGWYSEAVMAFALRMHHNIFKLDVDNPLPRTRGAVERLRQQETVGIVIDQGQAHWTAAKVVNDNIWYLDSQKSPELWSEERFVNHIQRFRHAFAIVNIA